MIWLRLAVLFFSGACDSLGGWKLLWMRRYLMPCVLAGCAAILITPHWHGILILPVIGTLCLGYFPWGNFGRALWLFLQSAVIGLGLYLTGHLSMGYYLLYMVGAGILGGTLVSVYQPIGDAIEGCWLGLIVLFIK